MYNKPHHTIDLPASAQTLQVPRLHHPFLHPSMADWLRPVFARKTPNLSALPHAERQGTPSIDDSVDLDEPAVPKMRSTSRVSSLIGGFRPNSPSIAMPDVFQGIKDPESTYHKPSADQASSTPCLCPCFGGVSQATGILDQGRMLTADLYRWRRLFRSS